MSKNKLTILIFIEICVFFFCSALVLNIITKYFLDSAKLEHNNKVYLIQSEIIQTHNKLIHLQERMVDAWETYPNQNTYNINQLSEIVTPYFYEQSTSQECDNRMDKRSEC